ncbi:glycoside hydrolase 43 family protein [Phenylobacterium deserti]|uniref:Xylan 1,4-beta-xylosidase n=1 Tax=Phenylobacterium deserti TaxID=1914756 RepID=A0A328A8H1_9CAUL|nr:glycoside hydrolase 43 family protein [Phenylobacterium deserti]RAK50821.1 xylan 1,4-beta-xylosidase [Phenylobacterium deserti]
MTMRATGLAILAALTAVPLGGFAPAAQGAGVYRNPVLFADYSDPDVIRVDDAYYMVASTFHFSPGLPVLKSRDLVHWTIIGHVLPKLTFAPEYDLPGPVPTNDTGARMPREQRAVGQRYAGGVWAPSIRHHNGLFYVYFATPNEGIYMATAEDPAGPWSAPVAVKAEAGLEDPCPFWDDDGQAYLMHGKVGAGPLVLHRMSGDGARVLDEGKVIVEDPKNLPVLEGPKLYKRNGWYYIFAPIGGVETGPQVALRSRNIWGPYEHRVVLEKGATAVQAPHQGGWVETPSGQGWFLHFNSTGAFGRIVHLQPVAWRDDWPIMGEPIPGSTAGQPVMEHAMPDVGRRFPAVFPQTSDDFAGAKLGVQWEWNHNPDDARWSLTERPGFLRLKSAPAPNLVSARNTLTQVQQSPASHVVARMDVRRMADGQRAGLSMFGTGPSWIGVVQQGGVRHIATSVAGAETLGPQISAGTLDLRLTVLPDQKARYAYSTDGGRTFTAVGQPAPFRFSWWKGARPAVFTYGAAGGYVDIDFVRVTKLQP